MSEQTSAVGPDATLGRFAGTWRGTNGFRLMPRDDLHTAPATALVKSVAGGHDIVLTYSWNHPEDGPQDGALLVGSPDEQQVVNAAWGDSWHQQPSILMLSGTLVDGRLEVTADYGGGWRWTISLEGQGSMLLTMCNVVPEEFATETDKAGPYPVMVGELHRKA